MGPEILSSVGVGVWGKAPEASPISNTPLDTFQSASAFPIRQGKRVNGSYRDLHSQKAGGKHGNTILCLDGPAIRNANRDDSHESIREHRFAEKPYSHHVRAIRANRLKPAIRNS